MKDKTQKTLERLKAYYEGRIFKAQKDHSEAVEGLMRIEALMAGPIQRRLKMNRIP